MLKTITLLRERVEDWTQYPFSIPTIAHLDQIAIHSRVCFFVGENGSGKSTLLEAIAAHYGFGPEGGTRNFSSDSTESNHSIEPLVRSLRLAFDKRTGKGFFLRAESLFNLASRIDEIDNTPGDFSPRIIDNYGGKSLHKRSHGEAFLTVLESIVARGGLFVFDEPEAALSPQRQLAFLVLLHDTLKRDKDAQFIIASHSPVLLGFPDAQIISFDEEHLHEVPFDEVPAAMIVRRFVNDRDEFLRELLRVEPTLFGDEQ